MKNAIEKIDKLIEEFSLEGVTPKMRMAAISAIGGLTGAGLDAAFNDGEIDADTARSMMAWAAGSALPVFLQQNPSVATGKKAIEKIEPISKTLAK